MDTGGATRITRILLTGPPGIGKTTVCKKVISLLEKQSLKFDGFYTEEVRDQTRNRIGFDIVPIRKPESRLPLARAESTLGQSQKTKYKVGQYHVFLKNFESIALPVFDSDAEILFIDEIGKMELFSHEFQDKIETLFFNSLRTLRVVATIPQMHKVPQRHLPLFQKLHADEKSKVVSVTKQNINDLPDEIVRLLVECS